MEGGDRCGCHQSPDCPEAMKPATSPDCPEAMEPATVILGGFEGMIEVVMTSLPIVLKPKHATVRSVVIEVDG
ncbi:hypothetical protein N7534_003791 [Penicillium rubens]|nr:hypothetical protein N7534_003791 [Penicillium rubens]